jgi:PAS domain S-box-containing protein
MKNQSFEDLTKIIELQQVVATAELELNDLMTLICKHTQSLTSAAGAVVEMVEQDEMVYRACSGSLEMTLGFRLKRSTSLSGMAVEKNEVLHCKDSETDERVNREACRKVGARSMICVPLLHKQKAVGVLKVVDPKDNKFSDRDIGVLRLIANLLSASISQAESHQMLVDSERKFRALIEGASDGILISQDGIVIVPNESLCRMFGYSFADFKNKKALELLTPEKRLESQENILSGHGTPYDSIGLRKDGSTFDIEILGKTLLINGQSVRMTTIRDISEKKQIENALRDSEKKSREVAKVKSEFLANMSHEIRTPLNGILGMTGLLLDTPLDPQQKDYVEIIKNSGDSLLSIVNDILDFSKIEAKKLVIEHIPFDLKSAVEDIRQILHYTTKKKGLKFITDLDQDLPVRVVGDPTRLRQVLLNLLSNAIKFTPTGSIKVRVLREKQCIKFEVIDTGIGIPATALANMFVPFTQVDSSTTRRFGGTGLGLSISKELITAMKGEIGVESSEGQGSTFWITLSLPEDKSSEQDVRVQTPSHHAVHRKLRVLIAEDNAVNSLIARKMIEKLGHTVTLAGNGKEAIEALKIAPYDVVLMDCQMPEMDGFEATKYIRDSKDDWKSVQIIAMTAHAMSGDRERCLAAGMDDYVSKPMKLEDLNEVLERVVKT